MGTTERRTIEQIYTTYIQKASEMNIEAITRDKFEDVINRSKGYMKKLYEDKDQHPYVVIPIQDGVLYLLAQLNERDGVAMVDTGIHTGKDINNIIGKPVIQETE